jgi:hypothetical protein
MAEKFEGRDLSGAVFHGVNLRGARFDDVNLEKATIRNANLGGLNIDDAFVGGLTIFGVRVDELLAAEFDRRDPERVRLRMADPHDLAEVRRVMARLDEVRSAFRDEVRACDPQLPSKRPAPDEWSVIEVVRHMLYAEDWYLKRWIAANDAPLHKAGLLSPFTQPVGEFACVGSEPPQDIEAALAAWAEVNARTRAFVAKLTPEDVRHSSHYPEARGHTAGQVLQQLARHDLDHIRQAQKVLSALNGEQGAR